ncbi:unnamed protein product [Adineta ricciae]|nr:unnamed protein product [Adineta ricciae]
MENLVDQGKVKAIGVSDITITTSNKCDHLEDFLKVNDENFQLADDDINEIDEAESKFYYRRCWKQQIDGS